MQKAAVPIIAVEEEEETSRGTHFDCLLKQRGDVNQV